MNIMTVLGNVLAPMSLLWMNIGLAAGIIIGALPGTDGYDGHCTSAAVDLWHEFYSRHDA